MVRKVIILMTAYFIFGVLTSCGDLLKYDATICDIQFAGLHSIGKLDNEEPDRFDDQIGFEIISIESSPTCYIPTTQVFNSAYATTKCAEYQNQLSKSSYKLSLDRSIILDNDTIAPNTDLLNILEIIELTDIKIDVECSFVFSTIIFRQDLVERIEFELGEYQVTFNCLTSDNREFTKTRKVIFEE